MWWYRCALRRWAPPRGSSSAGTATSSVRPASMSILHYMSILQLCQYCKYVNIAMQAFPFLKLSLWNTLRITIIATITGQTQVYATAQDVERKLPAEQSTQKIFSGFIYLVIEFQSTIRFRFHILISFDTRIMFSNAVRLSQIFIVSKWLSL